MVHQETPYKTIQRTKYIVQVVVCKLAAMSEKNSVCIFCNEGSTSSKRLTNNPDMIDKLVECCNERLSLGQSYITQLSDRLTSWSESERKCVRYHSECRKPIVNMSMIARLRSKRVRSDSPVYLARSAGRPINTTDSARPKRSKSTPKAKVCVFSSCSFCPNDTAGSLHRAFSGGTGESLIEIKLNTQDDHVRTCVSELEGAGDASALEKYYHRTCLRSAQRTFTPVFHSNVPVIRNVCDERLLLSIKNTLSDGVTLNIGEVNDAYLLILQRYHVEVDETTNYRKHLKQLNTEYLPNAQFVKSFRKNEPDNIVLPETVSKAIEITSTLLNNGEIIGQLKNIADIGGYCEKR